MAEFNALILQRQGQIERLKRILAIADAAEADASKLNHFKVAFRTIELCYKVCAKITDDIYLSIACDEDKTEAIKKQDKDREKDTAKLIDEYYWKIQMKYDELFGATASASGTHNNVKLPKLNLPNFDGKFTEWSSFKDLYVALVHSNSNLTDIEKFHYLISSLNGEPLNIVKSVAISNANYPVVVKQLFDRYDSKRRLAAAHWHAIVNLPPTVTDNSSALINLLSTVSENLAALSNIGLPTSEWGYIIFDLIFRKLPRQLCTKFEDQSDKNKLPDFDELRKFIEGHCDSLESVESLSNKKHQLPSTCSKVNNKHSFVASHTDIPKTKADELKQGRLNRNQCSLCKNNHTLSKCQDFLGNSPFDRLGVVKRLELCINCLRQGHGVRFCSSIHSCSVCGRKHHTLLHFDSNLTLQNKASGAANVVSQPKEILPMSNAASTSTRTNDILSLTAESNSSVLLSTLLVLVRDSRNVFQPVRALLDSGSQTSFISLKCLNRLGLPSSYCRASITGINHSSPVRAQGITSCVLRPRKGIDPQLQIEAIVLPSLVSRVPSRPVDGSQWDHIVGLHLADPDFDRCKSVDMILGAEVFSQIIKSRRISGHPGQPIAMETSFGWILMGRVDAAPSPLISLFTSVDHFDLRKFWEMEEVPQKQFLSSEDQLCEEKYAVSVHRSSDGRYIVSLPFKEPEPVFLGDSRSIALRRFKSLERKFVQDESFRSSYGAIFQEYLDSGKMEIAQPPSSKEANFYLPHHAVKKHDGNGTKLRIVLDASAKSCEGKSLNSCLLAGPKLQTDIANLLVNFRINRFAFTADIKGMFLQILVEESHRDYQRLLWRFDPLEPIQEYKLTRVTFGLTSSPFLAQRTIQQLVLDEGLEFPLASKALSECLYVDDVCCGTNTLQEAKQLQSELIELLKRGKFELGKWASNSTELLADIPKDDRQVINFDSSSDVLKILGLQWIPTSDCFTFRVGSVANETITTKRSILSDIARIYDPLGFLAPITFFAKHLIQYLWSLGLDWDGVPPSDVVEKWSYFKRELPLLSSLKIPRFLDLIGPDSHVELHGFCDSSEKGYAACIYLRQVHSDGRIIVHLLCAKSKVASLKKVTLPRLELCGAVLLCNLFRFVQNSVANKIRFDKIFAWCDSTIAISWIKSPPHKWKTFVANRVSHIQDIVAPDRWFYVKSADNAADVASRGLLPKDLVQASIWWNGPNWLQTSSETWPMTKMFPIQIVECEAAKPIQLACVAVQPDNSFDRLLQSFSSYYKIISIIAYVFRFLQKVRRQDDSRSGGLSHIELHKATLALCKHVQSDVFQEEIRQIKDNKLLSKPFRKLAPFLDEKEIIRVGGRLKHSDLSFDVKYPILLPKIHTLTNLIIGYFHEKYLHPGVQTLHYLLGQQFWIIGAKSAIHRCLSKCNRCFRVNPKPLVPIMGNLPSARVSQTKAFSHVGVDMGGPYTTSVSRYRGSKTIKSYICVFICFVTKAVHIELVSSLSSEAFLAALRRFVARRGRVSDIYSDCGTNFVGANTMLTQYVQQACDSLAIKWHFNPPAAPHMGGLWEAAIKSVKTHISRVIGEQIITFEEMTTLLTQIEMVLNSRPLMAISSDPNDLTALTPNHFLNMEPVSAPPDEDLSTITLNRLSRWQLVQSFHQSVWRRWHKEYLQTLQSRTKWHRPALEIAKGSLVVVKNENLPPGKWLLGRVQELHPGSDNVNRVATVLTKQGLFKRPLVKLCVLPTQ